MYSNYRQAIHLEEMSDAAERDAQSGPTVVLCDAGRTRSVDFYLTFYKSRLDFVKLKCLDTKI